MEEGEEMQPRREEEGDGDGDGEKAGNYEGEVPTHLPFAPATELSGFFTTVDPGYIISLIRKLLPHNVDPEVSPVSMQCDSASALVSRTKDTSLSTWSEELMSKIKLLGKNSESGRVSDHPWPWVEEDAWEECGCIIWDLAANRDHATFMVDNFLLDVLSMTLAISKSARITEICLGIIGNLACHDDLSDAISTSGLVQIVADQFTVNDTACLCELCRLLSVGLQGKGFHPWAEALSPEYVLQRVLWIAENTLNLQLLEKVMELFVAIVSHEEVADVLLPSLVKLGLPDLLISLLSCEMIKQKEERIPERISILDLILQAIEVLSTMDHHSQQISSNKDLFNLLTDIVKHPDKDEIGSCCGSALIIIANIQMDNSDHACNLFQDIHFFRGLLEIIPFVESDPPARGALWSIIADLLFQVQKNATSQSALQPYLSVLTEKASLIGDHLDDLSVEDHAEDFDAIKIAVTRIGSLLDTWKNRCTTLERSMSTIDDEKVESLMGYCCKYSGFM